MSRKNYISSFKRPSSNRLKFGKLSAEYLPMLLIWAAIVVLFGLLTDHFFTPRTMVTIAGQVPPLALICCGMTLVLIVGGIDLSVGSVIALSAAVLCVSLSRWELPLIPAIGLAIITGSAVGLFNGVVSVFLRIPSFIVSLGSLKIAYGLAMLITASETVTVGRKLEALANPLPGIGLPISFIVTILVVFAFQLLLNRTIYGRHLIAIGTNENATRLAGVETSWKKVWVFIMIGALTGLAAVFFAARLGGANADSGAGLELSAIAAVVIGGTSLMGGRGSVINSFIGALIILTLEAGLAQIGAPEYVKHMVTGLVIVVAVLLEALRGDLFSKLKRRFARAV